LKTIFRLLDKYGLASESKLNNDKCKGMLLGSLRNADRNTPGLDLAHFEEKLKILGVWISNGIVDTYHDNWIPIIEKINKVLNMWKARNMSIFGRCLIAKSKALSKVWYVASVMQMQKDTYDTIQQVVNNFIWFGKKQIISKAICYNKRQEGGLSNVHVEAKCRTIRVKWIRKVFQVSNQTEDWQALGTQFIIKCNLSILSIRVLCFKYRYDEKNGNVPGFYKEIINTWLSLKFERKPLNNTSDILEEHLWNNETLKTFNEGTVRNAEWCLGGIKKIGDIWNKTKNEFLDPNVINEKMGTVNRTINFRMSVIREYQILKGKIPNEWVEILERRERDEQIEHRNPNISEMFEIDKNKMATRNVYTRYLESNKIVKMEHKWNNDNNISIEKLEEFDKMNLGSDLENNIKEFIWKISHTGLILGDTRAVWYPNDPPVENTCKFCKQFIETHTHLFNDCMYINRFIEWTRTTYILRVQNNVKLEIFLNGLGNDKEFLFKAISKFEIWKLRNRIIFDNAQIEPENIVNTLKTMFKSKLKTTLEILLAKYNGEKKTQIFINKYCVENILTVRDNRFIDIV